MRETRQRDVLRLPEQIPWVLYFLIVAFSMTASKRYEEHGKNSASPVGDREEKAEKRPKEECGERHHHSQGPGSGLAWSSVDRQVIKPTRSDSGAGTRALKE